MASDLAVNKGDRLHLTFCPQLREVFRHLGADVELVVFVGVAVGIEIEDQFEDAVEFGVLLLLALEAFDERLDLTFEIGEGSAANLKDETTVQFVRFFLSSRLSECRQSEANESGHPPEPACRA